MINREMRNVEVLTYPSGVDAYGQKRQGTPTSTTIEMVTKIYTQSNVQDPRYVDVEMIGITKGSVTTANQIRFDSTIYNVLYVIPSGKYLQVLMKKK